MSKAIIASPLPGVFYRRPSADKPPYKSEGDKIAVGDVIGLVEIMKSFHEVKSEVAGTVRRFLVENEDAVSAGQSIAEVE